MTNVFGGGNNPRVTTVQTTAAALNGPGTKKIVLPGVGGLSDKSYVNGSDYNTLTGNIPPFTGLDIHENVGAADRDLTALVWGGGFGPTAALPAAGTPVLTLTVISDTEIKAEWQPTTGASTYRLRRKTGASTYFVEQNEATLSKLVENLTASTSYEFDLVAVGDNTHSDSQADTKTASTFAIAYDSTVAGNPETVDGGAVVNNDGSYTFSNAVYSKVTPGGTPSVNRMLIAKNVNPPAAKDIALGMVYDSVNNHYVNVAVIKENDTHATFQFVVDGAPTNAITGIAVTFPIAKIIAKKVGSVLTATLNGGNQITFTPSFSGEIANAGATQGGTLGSLKVVTIP